MEHGLIRQYLENLGYALDRLERGDRPPKEFFEQAVAFAREFVDGYHHYKEEHQMFVLLAQKKGGALDAQIEALRHQHEHGRRYITDIGTALEGYANGSEHKVLAVIENLAAYISMLRSHIHREDHTFYPLAKEALSEDDEKDLMLEFDKADRKAGRDFLDKSRDRIMKMEALLTRA